MRFLIDENIPRRCHAVLRQAGHEITDIRDIGMSGEKDTNIAAYAIQHQLCILSRDFDFADVRKFPPKKHAGIVVLSLPKTGNSVDVICGILNRFLSVDMPPILHGRLFIADKDRTRERD